MPIKFYVCRHGQDLDNEALLLNGHRNQPLTALGEKQAQTVAESIASNEEWGQKLDYIFSSPLQRANKTATTIADALNKQRQGDAGSATQRRTITVQVLNNLIERDFGCLTGKPLDDINKLPDEDVLRTDKVNYFLKAEGSEDFETLLKRARKVLEEAKEIVLSNKSDDDDDYVTRVLLVCHGDIMKMMLAVSKNLSWKEALMAPYIANTAVLEL